MKTTIGFSVQGMEKQMETTIMGCIGLRVQGLGSRRNGKEHGNCDSG